MPPILIEKLDVGCCELGEGPHWDASRQTLYFVDIFGKTIHKYVPSTKEHTQVTVGHNDVSFVIPVDGEKDKFVVGLDRQIAIVTWDGKSAKLANLEVVVEVDKRADILDNRFNDGKCDASGRLWAGTMGGQPVLGQINPHKGSLFSLTGRNVKTHLERVDISNGLAWSADNKKMFYIDTTKGVVDQYDYDIKTGVIANEKPIFTLSKHGIQGLLDGMTIDTDGNLWVAIQSGSRVIQINPNKPETLLRSIELPAKLVTSCTFGGQNLDELYVTSASFQVDDEEFPPPFHGATYVIKNTGAKGFPGVNFKLQ